MPFNFNKKVIFLVTIIITLIMLVSLIILFFNKIEPQKENLLAEVGNYQIFIEDREARITFEQCLNRSVNKTKQLGILFYFGFLENLKYPLNTNVTNQEVDNQYNLLQQKRKNLMMKILQEELDCLNKNFKEKEDKDIFYKVILRPYILEVKIGEAFDNSDINESYYEWMTNYLKSTIKIIVYDTEVCENVKSVYKDAWFRDLIVCK